MTIANIFLSTIIEKCTELFAPKVHNHDNIVGFPDYDNVVSVGNTTRTPETNVVVHCDKKGYSTTGYITIGTYKFAVSKGDAQGDHNHTYRSFYIAKGTTYTTEGLTEVLEIPLK